MKSKRYQSSIRIAIIVGFLCVFVAAVLSAQALGQNPAAQAFIANLGYFGVIIAAFVSGFNLIVPLPAATLTPLFLGAGLSLPLIIVALAIGTIMADFTAYALGHVSRDVIKTRYPRTYALFERLGEQRSIIVYPLVLFYASFVPFPNEVIIIPMAVAGFRFRTLIIPLLIGSLINQSLLVFGITTALGSL